MNDPLTRYERFERDFLAAIEAGCADKPLIQERLAWGLSPLGNGRISEKSMAMAEAQIAREFLAARLRGEPPPTIPDYDPRTSIEIANIVGTTKTLRIPLTDLASHACLCGTTGCGKTTAQAVFIDGLIAKKIHVDIFARKEAGRFLRRYRGAALFRPDQLPVNLLEPIGSPHVYFGELAPILTRGIGLSTDYTPAILDALIRSHAGQP